MRYHAASTRMAFIKKTDNNKCCQGYRESGTDPHTSLLCGHFGKIMSPLWKTVRKLLKKLNIELPYDPVIPLLGTKLVHKGSCCIIHHSQKVGTAQMFIS